MPLSLVPNKTPKQRRRRSFRRPVSAANPLVLLVEDDEEKLSEFKFLLEHFGYRVVDTDNGQDAAKRARYSRPDLLLIDLNVPLPYELVAARQIVKESQIGTVPVVIVTREDVVDPYPMMDAGVRHNEYVTRLCDHGQLLHLLGFLLPVEPSVA